MPEQVVVRIVGDAKDLARATDEATGALGGMKRGVGGLSLPLLGVAGLAAGAAVAIADMTMAAAADRDEQLKLEAALKAAGAATGDYQAEVEAAIASGQRLAFTDSDIRAALVPLTQVTGDVTAATDLLTTAQDIARLKGVDLETAANAVAKAHEGQAGALTRLIPALAGAEEGTDLVAEAQRLAAGQADAFASSTEGQLAASGIAFDELKETIGSAFLPVLDQIVPLLVPIITKLGELAAEVLPPLIEALTPMVEALGMFIDLAGEIISRILPVIIPHLRTFGDVLKRIAGFIGDVIKVVGDLLKALQDMIKPLQDALGGLQDLVSFELPDIVGGIQDILPFGAPAPPAGARRLTGTVNVYTGADPQSVVRIVRAHLQANGSL